jgi:hypothetical protein
MMMCSNSVHHLIGACLLSMTYVCPYVHVLMCICVLFGYVWVGRHELHMCLHIDMKGPVHFVHVLVHMFLGQGNECVCECAFWDTPTCIPIQSLGGQVSLLGFTEDHWLPVV